MRTLITILLTVALLISATGCTSYVFNTPRAISTRSKAGCMGTPIQRVSVSDNDYMLLFIPIVSDPRNLHDDLLDSARKVGGNAVTDVQVRGDGLFWFFPLFMVHTWEATGTATKIE